MTNAFYNPSGNPGQGSEGLSASIRAEFTAIGAGFDALPAFLTTGNFVTTFNQVGDYTFTLPGFSGTLATLADIATETTRATEAEAANAVAISVETTARTAAVAAETSRATTAEAANAVAISAETTARILAVAGEASRAMAAEGANATAISAETTARAAADAALLILIGTWQRSVGAADAFGNRTGYTIDPGGNIRQAVIGTITVLAGRTEVTKVFTLPTSFETECTRCWASFSGPGPSAPFDGNLSTAVTAVNEITVGINYQNFNDDAPIMDLVVWAEGY